MWRTAALFLLIAGPAQAALTVEECVATSDSLASCRIRNDGTSAVGSVSYSILVTETGRTFPWSEGRGAVTVPGGIEPGEAVDVPMPFATLPPRARGRTLVISAMADDADSQAKSRVSIVTKLTGAGQSPVSTAIERCWSIGTLSSEAARTTVVVEFDVSPDMRPVMSSIRMVSADGGSANASKQAYEAARRAIIRCAGEGYPLDPAKRSEWKTLSVEFGPGAPALK